MAVMSPRRACGVVVASQYPQLLRDDDHTRAATAPSLIDAPSFTCGFRYGARVRVRVRHTEAVVGLSPLRQKIWTVARGSSDGRQLAGRRTPYAGSCKL